MVAVSSPQTNESEQKRRKQTLERAKANHLSKQLQMRLQYAKLKVEHGWQRQNLNEVENLYFHHSHLRGPRPTTLSKPQPTTFTPSPTSNPVAAGPSTVQLKDTLPPSSNDANLFVQAIGHHNFTETQGGLCGLSGAEATSDTSATDEENRGPGPASYTVTPPYSEPPVSYNGKSSSPPTFSESQTQPQMQADNGSTTSRNNIRRSPAHSSTDTILTQSSQADMFSPTIVQLSGTHSPTPFFPSPTSRSEPFDFSADPLRPALSREPSQSHLSARRPSAPSISSSNTVNQIFSTNSPLTYDSFWSSHSSSTLAYRNMLSSAGIMGGNVNPTLAIRSGNGVVGIPSPLIHATTFDASRRGLTPSSNSPAQIVSGNEAR
ncbi:hypothetical protein SERLA73DRAFT_80083 [Serpula lacrymans var. lacrymans S7.3]|uniref:Uncharacterized protein n=2 Tax=Serpula lacrymans var. lacrymans TaxID=341189 RepID=F8QIN0_SERL3|nr:uncharacterized protein SERLADRAFT_436399 [Serpula lacrymans var. lacrymans S7.9]EGN91832.1 hypothetical protein SERLA73DRAFT_80083 [Serpula lacrymans var. lacrymans S7.3]EGO26585.1 hypothetical protein SERLADRAFT_436399 [Serpula lacrymans var. lacrymans S7.9]